MTPAEILLFATLLVVLLLLALLVLGVVFVFRVAYGMKLNGKLRFDFDGVRETLTEAVQRTPTLLAPPDSGAPRNPCDEATPHQGGE